VPAMSAIPAAFNNAFGAIKAVVQYVLCKFCGKSISSQGHQYHEVKIFLLLINLFPIPFTCSSIALRMPVVIRIHNDVLIQCFI
jgi:hypothetical protein